MPPRAVTCELCGGKFFAHSLDHHKKVCRERAGKQNHECAYCRAAVPMLEMDAHIRKCPDAKAAGAKPTGASAALAARLQQDRDRAAGGGSSAGPKGGGASAEAPPEYTEGDDVRIPCQVCGRKFAMDRVGKHQSVCERLAHKAPRKEFTVTRTYCEGGSSGAVVGVASTSKRKGPAGAQGLARNPTPPPVKSDWRKQSAAFREACKAGREYPMPQWGAADTRKPPPSQSTARRVPVPRGGGAGAGGGGGAGGGRPAGQADVRSRTTPQSSPSRPQRPPESSAEKSKTAAQVKDQFRNMDMDGDGTLDMGELAVFLRTLHPGITDQNMKTLFRSIDKDRNGRVDFNEFVDFVFSEAGSAATPGGGGQGQQQQRSSGAKPLTSSAAGGARQRPGAQTTTRLPAVQGRNAPLEGGHFSTSRALPEWGSNAPSKYGRDCMTAPSAYSKW